MVARVHTRGDLLSQPRPACPSPWPPPARTATPPRANVVSLLLKTRDLTLWTIEFALRFVPSRRKTIKKLTLYYWTWISKQILWYMSKFYSNHRVRAALVAAVGRYGWANTNRGRERQAETKVWWTWALEAAGGWEGLAARTSCASTPPVYRRLPRQQVQASGRALPGHHRFGSRDARHGIHPLVITTCSSDLSWCVFR